MSDFSMHSSCQQAVNYNFLMFSVISLLASWLKPVEESIEWKVSSPRRCVPVCRIMDEEKRRFACERTTLWMLYHTSRVEPWNTDSSAASWWEKGSKHFQRGWFLRRSEKALPIILQHARQLRRDWYLFLMNINTAILFCFFRLWDGLVAVSRCLWSVIYLLPPMLSSSRLFMSRTMWQHCSQHTVWKVARPAFGKKADYANVYSLKNLVLKRQWNISWLLCEACHFVQIATAISSICIYKQQNQMLHSRAC